MASSPNWVGSPCLTAKPPHLPGPQLLREPNPPARWYLPSQARAGGPPWGRVLRVACGVCAQGPGAPHCQRGRKPGPEGGVGSVPQSPALETGSPQAPTASLGATSPTAGGPEASGLPDKELVGLMAPRGMQQGWEALQSTSHGPRRSSPCRSVQNSARLLETAPSLYSIWIC